MRAPALKLAEVIELVEPFLQRWEGLARVRRDGLVVPYLCPAGYPTQGYGRVVASLAAPPIDEATARFWLFQDICRHALEAIVASPGLATESAPRVAAITSFVFNLGPTRYRGSTLKKRVDAGRWAEVPAELRRWIFAAGQPLPGLRARREAEVALLLGGQS